MITNRAPDLHDRVIDLLASALTLDKDGDVTAIDGAIYHATRELALPMRYDWRSILLQLPDRVPDLGGLLWRPHLWIQLSHPDTWRDEARLFACDCAERSLPLFEAQHPDDGRPRRAIETARRFARGEATRDELGIAQSAARDAGNAATCAAEAAALAAGNAAAWAARAAAWNAAEAAAWDAERSAQWTMLVDRMCGRVER